RRRSLARRQRRRRLGDGRRWRHTLGLDEIERVVAIALVVAGLAAWARQHAEAERRVEPLRRLHALDGLDVAAQEAARARRLEAPGEELPPDALTARRRVEIH